jgi:hypothetical protein
MPLYKHVANRALTLTENILLGRNLSKYHTGYRAWSRGALQTLPMNRCSDDFVFDNQVLVQAVHWGFRLDEISCPTHYFPEASSMGPMRSVVYGLGVLEAAARYRLHHLGLVNCSLIAPDESTPCAQVYETSLS